MATTYGSYFPGITDGLVFNFDPKNKKCWSGGETVHSFYPGESISGSGANTGGSDWSGTLTNEGYFSLDGTDGHLNFTEFKGNSLMTNTDTTICFWLKTTDTQFVFMAPPGGGGGTYFAATNGGGWYEGSAAFQGPIYNNGVVDTSGSFDGNWHYYVFTDVAFQSTEWDTKGLGIANYIGTSFDLEGDVGPIQIYNRVLSTDECSLNYNVQKQRFGL